MSSGLACERLLRPASGRLRVLSVFGTRPEAIKFAPLLQAFAGDPRRVESVICVTGQQRDLLRQTLAALGLRPDFDLDLMRPDQEPIDVCARVMAGVRDVLNTARPDLVLVQGDTTSTLGAALAAAHARIPLGHIEAGLRTFDDENPFPEEMNRRLVDQLAAVLFPPTAAASANLERAGISGPQVFQTGNTSIDVMLDTIRQPGWAGAKPSGEGPRSVLVTCHRRENLGEGVRRVCQALRQLAESSESLRIRYVLHPNPQSGAMAARWLEGVPGVELIPPMDYPDLLLALRASHIVLTDSGGLQEEAPVFGKPVLVLREATERPEGIAAGVARLVGTRVDAIVEESRRLLTDPEHYRRMSRAMLLYGDGKAAARIHEWLLYHAALTDQLPQAFEPIEAAETGRGGHSCLTHAC